MASKKLKVSVDADASGFREEMEVAKKSARDFSNTVGDVAVDVEDSLGVPVGAIAEIGYKIKNVCVMMKVFTAQGETAFQKIVLGAGVAAGAIAGIGLTALIAAFKTLTAEAERFRGTVEGTAQTLRTEAWTDTFSMALNDLTGMGREMSGLQDKLSKFWGLSRGYFTALVGGALTGGMGGAAKNLYQYFDGIPAAMKKADAAGVLAGEIFETSEKIKDSQIEWKRNLADVAELMLTASDKSKTCKERQEAVAAAMELQKRVSGEQIEMQERLADSIKKRNDLASSSVEDMDRQRAASAAVEDMGRDLNQKLREMTSLQNEIAASAAAVEQKWREGVNKAIEAGMTEVAKFNAEMEKAMELRQKMSLDSIAAPLVSAGLTGRAETGKDGLVGGGGSLDEEALKGLMQRTSFSADAVAGLLESIDPSKLSGAFEGYYKYLDEMVKATDEANQALSSAIVEGISGSFQYLANCVAGIEEISGAGMMSALLTPLAEAAIKMGEILVSAGIASEAFKSMLSNPYTAIAAGAALIAIGAAAKAGLQAAVNSATGTSYVASSVASSGYSSGSTGDRSWEREMTLHVTGTLQADGSKLVAVLNNEANRRQYTT